jgi:hypothetical protein
MKQIKQINFNKRQTKIFNDLVDIVIWSLKGVINDRFEQPYQKLLRECRYGETDISNEASWHISQLQQLKDEPMLIYIQDPIDISLMRFSLIHHENYLSVDNLSQIGYIWEILDYLENQYYKKYWRDHFKLINPNIKKTKRNGKEIEEHVKQETFKNCAIIAWRMQFGDRLRPCEDANREDLFEHSRDFFQGEGDGTSDFFWKEEWEPLKNEHGLVWDEIGKRWFNPDDDYDEEGRFIHAPKGYYEKALSDKEYQKRFGKPKPSSGNWLI